MIIRMPMIALITAFCIFVAGGCGSGDKKGTAEAATPGEKDALADLKSLLEDTKTSNRKPPSSKAELMQHDATNPVAAGGIARGQVVYVYGQGLTGGTNIIAYDAKCETEGGWVLLQDGTMKSMSADEFKSAPKAVKK